MGIFNFKKKKNSEIKHEEVLINRVEKLTEDSVRIVFNSNEHPSLFQEFIPGQYIPVEVEIEGNKHRRSYSVCSSKEENLAIGVKRIKDGIVSNYLNQCVEGQKLKLFKPEGKFVIGSSEGKIVCIAAGSGITPILSIFKSNPNREFILFYGNKTVEKTMFLNEIDALSNVVMHCFYSQVIIDGCKHGRITKEAFTEIIKEDLSILKASEFFICGPQEMTTGVQEALKMFGIHERKIHFELFTSDPKENVLAPNSEKSTIESYTLQVELDDERYTFEKLDAKKTILELLDSNGIDAPYSCRGGVCSSCKAKVIEGDVQMRLNYSLTDEEVKEGYVLTCQSLCYSPNIKISFDE